MSFQTLYIFAESRLWSHEKAPLISLRLTYHVAVIKVMRAVSGLLFAYCLVFATAATLTQMVSIAPGGLGMREPIIAAVGSLVGVEVGISLIAAGIDRVIALAIINTADLVASGLMGQAFTRAPAPGQGQGMP